ncbi:ALP1-like protein [Tanacetum coccineum]
MKCTSVIRQMAYEAVSDALDEYMQMGATTALEPWENCPILHAFFGVAGINKDVNVLRQSLLFNDLKAGKAPDVPFVANNVTYKRGYYLTDGIYPEWSVLIKSIKNPGVNDHKRILYKMKHEAARKDVERAFGVLKKKYKLIKHPTQGMMRRRLSEEQHRDDDPVRTRQESMEVT